VDRLGFAGRGNPDLPRNKFILETNLMSRRAAIFLVLLSALGFGTIAMFAKLAYGAGVGPTMLLALRFVLAAAFLAPVIWFKRIPLPRGRVFAGFVLMGALYTAQAQSYFTALLYASSGLVGLL